MDFKHSLDVMSFADLVALGNFNEAQRIIHIGLFYDAPPSEQEREREFISKIVDANHVKIKQAIDKKLAAIIDFEFVDVKDTMLRKSIGVMKKIND